MIVKWSLNPEKCAQLHTDSLKKEKDLTRVDKDEKELEFSWATDVRRINFFKRSGNWQHLVHLNVCVYPTTQHWHFWVYTKRSADKCIMNTDTRDLYGFDPWVRKIPRSRKRQLTPVFLPRKFHGQRSPVGHRWNNLLLSSMPLFQLFLHMAYPHHQFTQIIPVLPLTFTAKVYHIKKIHLFQCLPPILYVNTFKHRNHVKIFLVFSISLCIACRKHGIKAWGLPILFLY